MAHSIRPFLMFTGRAEEAMNFYVSAIPGSEIVEVERYGAGGPAPEGSVMRALFRVADQEVMCTDSFVKHAFDFTPSSSLFVTCDGGEAEVDRLAGVLGEGGGVLMPPGAYGFSRRFAWVADRFGVSWQFNAP